MAALPRIRFVCATRCREAEFHTCTALGRSLKLYPFPYVELRLFAENAAGLPVCYNRALDEARDAPAILVFVHDDIHLCDFFWPDRLTEALARFDFVGLAGNRRRLPLQPGWLFLNLQFEHDTRAHISGVVGHGKGFPPEVVTVFGPPLQEVKLLDGLFLAARSDTLNSRGIRFDERFDFHFYDLDICRAIEAAGLRMGTAALSVVHESRGNFGSQGWKIGYLKYIEKWKS